MRHAISWFELPVTDLGRAATFYGAILGSKLGEVTRAEDRLYVMFPAEEGVGGALVQGEGYVPSPNGCLPFLNAGDSLEPVVGRVPSGRWPSLGGSEGDGRLGGGCLHRGQ
jgi:uncharacterized protein